jgi:hypothetical protein
MDPQSYGGLGKTTKQPITFCVDPQSYGGLGKQQSNHHILEGFSSYGSFKNNNKAVPMFCKDSRLIEASKDNNKAVTDSTGILSTMEGVDKPTAFYGDPHLMEALKTTTEQLHCKTFGAC